MSRNIPENLYSLATHNFEAIEMPTFREARNKEWVMFGDDNLYPQRLIELYQSSAINHTAINAKVAGVVGEGFKVYGETVVNEKGQTLNDIFRNITMDYMVYGGYAINIVWNRKGDRIAEMYHTPFANLRSGKQDENDEVHEYFYSSDWKQVRKYKPVTYPAYNPQDNKGENASQILYCKEYAVGTTVYPLPQWQGAVNDVDLDARISRYHNANISNGLSPSLMINFRNGIPTPEERQMIVRDIEQSFAGETNAGRFMTFFNEVGKEVQVTPIESANDTYYSVLEERVTSRILTAHRITSPLLLGIRDAGGGLGSNRDEILVAYGHFFGTVLQPIQKKLVGKLTWLTDKMGYGLELEVEPSTIILDDETVETDENTEEIA